MKKIVKLFIMGILVLFPCMVHAETLDVNSNEVKDLVKKYNIGGMYFYRFKNYNIDTMTDGDFASFTTYLNDQLIENNKTQRPGTFNGYNITLSVITKEIYNQGFKNIFGPDVSVKSLSQGAEDTFCGTYKYNSTSDDYQAYEACGGLWPFDYYVNSATKEDQKITIDIKGLSIIDGSVILGSNEKKVPLKDLGLNNDTSVLNENFLKQYKDYADTYKYTFKKASDNNYYFYSVENLKDAKEYKSSTTTITKTSTKEKNPKTADSNLLVLISIGIIMVVIIAFSGRKVLKK